MESCREQKKTPINTIILNKFASFGIKYFSTGPF